MRNNDRRLFIKNDAVYVTIVFVSVVIFIALLAAQIFTSLTPVRYYIGIGLMLLAFLMNVFEGKFGYYITFALNFVQFMIYTYEYVIMRNESAPLLLMMTFLVMVINLLLQYYIIKVAGKIQHIEDAKRNERGKAIRKELEDEMFSRTSLIVNHESMGSHHGLSEAIGRNLTSSIDPLTTLPGRDMITERAYKLIREDIANMRESDVPDSVCRPFTVIYLALDHFDNFTKSAISPWTSLSRTWHTVSVKRQSLRIWSQGSTTQTSLSSREEHWHPKQKLNMPINSPKKHPRLLLQASIQ